jgi:hypothetical protein
LNPFGGHGRGGDTDLARSDLQNENLTSGGDLGHDLDSTVGKPILAQNSSSTSAFSLSGSMSNDAINGSSSNPSHATSSASSRASSPATSSSSRQRKRDPDVEGAGDGPPVAVGGEGALPLITYIHEVYNMKQPVYILACLAHEICDL